MGLAEDYQGLQRQCPHKLSLTVAPDKPLVFINTFLLIALDGLATTCAWRIQQALCGFRSHYFQTCTAKWTNALKQGIIRLMRLRTNCSSHIPSKLQRGSLRLLGARREVLLRLSCCVEQEPNMHVLLPSEGQPVYPGTTLFKVGCMQFWHLGHLSAARCGVRHPPKGTGHSIHGGLLHSNRGVFHASKLMCQGRRILANTSASSLTLFKNGKPASCRSSSKPSCGLQSQQSQPRAHTVLYSISLHGSDNCLAATMLVGFRTRMSAYQYPYQTQQAVWPFMCSRSP